MEELNKIEKEIYEDKSAESHIISRESDELEERKKRIIKFLKEKKDWIFYLCLAFITFIGVYVRTRNIPKLKDIATGGWTLGPDLDPWLFQRWAEYIVEHGKLFMHDSMRYVPLGFDTAGEMKFLAYMIAWFHNILATVGLSDSVTYSAILFPAFMFALTTIAFFLFSRKVFYKENKTTRNLIALIATAFFVLIPSLLPRTIAGIPEKESAAFFFMFMAFYFFISAYTAKKFRNGLIFGALAGAMTAGMALIWGGVIFIFFAIVPAVFFAYLLGKIKWKEYSIYCVWLFSAFILMIPFSTRYGIKNLIVSTSTAPAIALVFILAASIYLTGNRTFRRKTEKIKFPKEVIAVAISVLGILILAVVFLGFDFITDNLGHVKNSLIEPQSSRFGFTVAENKQPYFIGDWQGSFGPVKFGLPLYFWLFFIASVVMFNKLVKPLDKKDRRILTFGYLVFLTAIIFSRYSPSSALNGLSGLSLLLYFGGTLGFLYFLVRVYRQNYVEGSFGKFKEINFGYVLYFFLLTLGIIGARGGIRLIMVLGAISPVAIGFMLVATGKRYLVEKEDSMKFFIGVVAIILILASLTTIWAYYQNDKIAGENFAPGMYNQQWQKAMAWVRENTSEDAVFAHWWDYGYWVQSIGERATILDGGNAIVYWDYLMGRKVLTEPKESEALDFLYSHNGTHLLIDSTDIGKYTAFSSIGSDENYDRFSWINTFGMDESQTRETSEKTHYLYTGGATLDEDIVWEIDGSEVFLPRKKAVVGGFAVTRDSNGDFLQTEAIFIYNGQQYSIPLKYNYVRGELIDYGEGLNAGIFIMPSIDNQGNVNLYGVLLYLSPRVVDSQLAQLYLFDQDSNYFKLVHTEDNAIVASVKMQRSDIGDFIYYQGIQGPIKIWEVSYPEGMEINEEYLQRQYPNPELSVAKPGEY